MIDSVPSAKQDDSASELISASVLPLDSDSGARQWCLDPMAGKDRDAYSIPDIACPTCAFNF